MVKKIKTLMFMLLLGGCLCLCACRQKETVEPSAEDTPAPVQWEDVVKDGRVDQDKYNEYMGISVPEQNPLEEVPENVVLLGATSNEYQYIYMKVNSFNQAQDEYKVEVRKYEGTDAMFLDLVRGKGCDLLVLSPTDLKILADKGGLEDLAPFLEKSEKVGREDLFDVVVEAGTAGGKLAGILPSFNVDAILVEKGYTGDGGWTVEEYLALMDKYPDVPLSVNADPNFILGWILFELSALPESFVNWEERTCSFESEAFVQTIEVLRDYVARCRKPEHDLMASKLEKLYKRQVQTLPIDICYDQYFLDYVDIRDAFLEDYELAGLPNQEGEVKYTMKEVLGETVLYSMNAASLKKESAWLFLEYMLSEYQETVAEKVRDGFPARRDIVERLLQEEVEAEAIDKYFVKNRYTNETVPKRGSFTEEDKEQLLYILDHAAPPPVLQGDRTFRLILTEELNAFLAGDKTAAETAHLIQNRMTMYLSE